VGSLGETSSESRDINEQGWVFGFSDSDPQWFLAIPGNTAAGANVGLQPSSTVGMTFATVTVPGDTTAVSTGAPAPLPANFQVSGATYYEIHTTATYSGNIQLILRYDPSMLPDGTNVHLLHYDLSYTNPADGSHWQDVTTRVDTVNHLVYG